MQCASECARLCRREYLGARAFAPRARVVLSGAGDLRRTIEYLPRTWVLVWRTQLWCACCLRARARHHCLAPAVCFLQARLRGDPDANHASLLESRHTIMEPPRG